MEALILVGHDSLSERYGCAISILQNTHIKHGIQIVWVDSQGLIVHEVGFEKAAIGVLRINMKVQERVFFTVSFTLLTRSGNLCPGGIALQTSKLG